MTLDTRQSIASPPTLFRVGNANAKEATVRARWRVDSKEFRIDGPSPEVPAPASGFAKTERRLARHLAALSAHPSGRDYETPAGQDLFHDHAGDLVNRMSQWSLRLDRRESDLDVREGELNRLARLLRQSNGYDGAT